MADSKISALTALTGANVADDDEFVIVDTSAVETKRITRTEILKALGLTVTVTIGDDSVGTVTPLRNGGFCFLTTDGDGASPDQSASTMFYYDCGSTAVTEETADFTTVGSDVEFSDGTTLTGTTGTDVKLTVAVQTDGTIDIENRLGASVDLQLTFL